MSKKLWRVAAMTMALAGAISLMACGSKESKPTESGSVGAESSAAAGTEKHVDLVMYLPGPRPARYDASMEKLNELTEKDLNCSIDVKFIEFGDMPTKYPLLFSSGEEFDLAYAGNWQNFANLAQKGAFMPLEDLLPKYCQESLKVQPEESLEQATINGHLYAYPTNFYTYSAYGVTVRGDMMEKYGFDEITDIDNYFEFLEAVKAGGETQFTNLAGMWQNHVLTDIYLESKGLYPINGGQYGIYYIDSSGEKPTVIAAHEWSGFREYLTKAKKWADEGMWPKSALSITDNTTDMLKAGTCAGGFNNFDQGVDIYTNCDPSWDIRWYNVQPNVNHLAYTQDCMVVPASCKNPERALMFLDKVKTDETYYNLLTYGIEGEDFVRDPNNPKRFTATDPTQFQPEPGTWGFRSQEFYLVSSLAPENYEEQKQALEDATVENIFRNFNMDTDPVKTEYAAMMNVYSQYEAPLSIGLTNDIDKDLAQLTEQANIAGNEKIKAELQRQVDEFYAANQK